jgi:hypothetical protein
MVAIAARAGAQESPLSLRVTGADTFEAHTRQAITFALAVSNEGPQRRTLALEYLLPDGWKALTPESPFSLEPSAHDLRVVSFLIPSRAPAGE